MKIVALQGTEDVHFGMSPSLVSEMVGIDATTDRRSKQTIVQGKKTTWRFSEDGLFEFSVLPHGEVEFEGTEVFSKTQRSAFREYLDSKYECVEYAGYRVYASIGLALSGFDGEEQTESVTVFAEGAWDDIS